MSTAPGLRRAEKHVLALAALQRRIGALLDGPSLLTVAALQLRAMAEKEDTALVKMIDVQNDPDVLAIKLTLLNSMPELTGRQINDAAIYAVMAIRERAISPHAAALVEAIRLAQ